MKYLMRPDGHLIHKVVDTTNWAGYEEVTVIRHTDSRFNWRDAFMALVNRTQSGELHITDEEIQKASETQNAMIIEPGKTIIQSGGLRMPWPDEQRIDNIGQNGSDGDHYD
jgi:hypothetical protein